MVSATSSPSSRSAISRLTVVVGKRLDYRLVEFRCLVRPQKLTHREHMGERLLLQPSHRLVRSVDCRLDAGTGTVFRFDRFGKKGVVGLQLKLERGAPDRE